MGSKVTLPKPGDLTSISIAKDQAMLAEKKFKQVVRNRKIKVPESK